MAELAAGTVRASSLVENLNSRLRSYFFLRRHLGPEYLALLQFFLNHRRLERSDRPERMGKTPAELLTGQAHPHWLEMLGYTRFSRAWSRIVRGRLQTLLVKARSPPIVLPEKRRFRTRPADARFRLRKFRVVISQVY